MDKINDRLLAAIREAKLAYEFDPNSYTYAALHYVSAAHQHLSEIENLIRHRLSY